MAAFRPHLSAYDVDLHLRRSLEELRAAEKNAVLWFGEVLHRKLYRELGHSSIHQYATVSLGFGKSKTAQFIRLAESLRDLPRLRKSVAKGELSWTKAREVAKVASPKTEREWIAEARRTTSRELERTVTATRRRARAARGKAGDQEMFAVVGNVCVKTEGAAKLVAEVPVGVSVRFTPEQYARYEALLEKLRKQGQKESREELLLAGLEELVCANRDFPRGNSRGCPEGSAPRRSDRRSNEADALGRGGRIAGTRRVEGATEEASSGCFEGAGSAETNGDRPRAARAVRPRANGDRSRAARGFPRVNSASPYQVVVQVCERCKQADVETSRGPKPIANAALKTILCDAKVYRRGEKNRATVPPSLKLQAMVRDRHRCRGAGCGSARFLNVHHIVPREAGGPNSLDNLITLCSGCHRTLHDLAGRDVRRVNSTVE